MKPDAILNNKAYCPARGLDPKGGAGSARAAMTNNCAMRRGLLRSPPRPCLLL